MSQVLSLPTIWKVAGLPEPWFGRLSHFGLDSCKTDRQIVFFKFRLMMNLEPNWLKKLVHRMFSQKNIPHRNAPYHTCTEGHTYTHTNTPEWEH